MGKSNEDPFHPLAKFWDYKTLKFHIIIPGVCIAEEQRCTYDDSLSMKVRSGWMVAKSLASPNLSNSWSSYYNNFRHLFQAPSSNFDTVYLNISSFEPYYRGRKVPDASPLDASHITSIEILAYAGVFRVVKQRGVASLEIDWIRLEWRSIFDKCIRFWSFWKYIASWVYYRWLTVLRHGNSN